MADELQSLWNMKNIINHIDTDTILFYFKFFRLLFKLQSSQLNIVGFCWTGESKTQV